jgi:hypothetical protein
LVDGPKLNDIQYWMIMRAFRDLETTIEQLDFFKAKVYETPSRPGYQGPKERLDAKLRALQAGFNSFMSPTWQITRGYRHKDGYVGIVVGVKMRVKGMEEFEEVAGLQIRGRAS